MTTLPAPRRLTVDGEVFEVRPSEDGHGFDFDWLSGSNPGYRFSSGAPMTFTPSAQAVVAPSPADDQALTAQIRLFLAQIDPGTGYIED